MTNFSFATCERRRALGFLRAIYSKHEVNDTGRVAALLDLVEADIMRIQDPMMHKPAQVIAGSAWDEGRRCECVAICAAAHEEILAQPERLAGDGVTP